MEDIMDIAEVAFAITVLIIIPAIIWWQNQ
jgi:hypothetical protein